MTQAEFTEVLKDFLERSIGEMQRKRPDYAEVREDRDDVLANFKEVGRRTGMTALQCAMVYFEKHLITLEKYTRGLALKSEPIDGRLIDLLNYLTLINAVVVELQQEEIREAPAVEPYAPIEAMDACVNQAVDASINYCSPGISASGSAVVPAGAAAPKFLSTQTKRAIDTLTSLFTTK